MAKTLFHLIGLYFVRSFVSTLKIILLWKENGCSILGGFVVASLYIARWTVGTEATFFNNN
jgi:hypothetical protein